MIPLLSLLLVAAAAVAAAAAASVDGGVGVAAAIAAAYVVVGKSNRVNPVKESIYSLFTNKYPNIFSVSGGLCRTSCGSLGGGGGMGVGKVCQGIQHVLGSDQFRRRRRKIA